MLCSFLSYSKVIQIYILFHYRLLQGIECSSLCYTVGSCYLSLLRIVMCSCQSQAPNLTLLSLSLLVTKNFFPMSVSLFLLKKKFICVRGHLTLRNSVCCHFSRVLCSLSVLIPGTSETACCSQD